MFKNPAATSFSQPVLSNLSGKYHCIREHRLKIRIARQINVLCLPGERFGAFARVSTQERPFRAAERSVAYIAYPPVIDLPDGAVQIVPKITAWDSPVLSADGKSMWQREEPEIKDICRQRRTDFFLAQRVTLPPTLPAGEYVLKVYVEDKLSGRASEATHPFTIIEQATLTAGR